MLDFSKSGWSHKPQPPEKCTVIHQTVSSLRVGCYTPPEVLHHDHPDDVPTTYVLQVYDAGTRHLLASATSQMAGMLEITDLPTDHRDLVLSVRTVTAHAMSDAVSIYTILPEQQDQDRGGKTAFDCVKSGGTGTNLSCIISMSVFLPGTGLKLQPCFQ